jgi:hypothetical protein
MRKFLIIYFVILILLSLASFSPPLFFFAAIFTGGILGLVVIAANTVLLYSVASLPTLVALTSGPIAIVARSVFFWIALGILVVVAVAPGLISQQSARSFVTTLSHSDFARRSSERPKSIELGTDDWDFQNFKAPPYMQAPCNDLCRRLLFNHEVERVRMVNLPHPFKHPGGPVAVTYTIENSVSCADAVWPNAADPLEEAVRDRIASGECLISTTNAPGRTDASLLRKTLYNDYAPAIRTADLSPPPWVKTKRIKRVNLTQRHSDGSSDALVQQTEFRLETYGLPFYFSYVGTMNIERDGPTPGSTPVTYNAIDVAQTLRKAFGFSLDPVKPLQASEVSQLIDRILSLTTTDAFNAQQTGVINDAVSEIIKKSELSKGDLAFVRRVIADPRINDPQIGINIRASFRKFPTQFEPLIGVVVERLVIPAPQGFGTYEPELACSLQAFTLEELRPYRERIHEVKEKQPKWSTTACSLLLP